MNQSKPIFELRGRNYWRYLSILLLIGLIGFTIYLIQVIGFIILLGTASSIFLLSAIQFPVLLIYNESFVINKKSIIKKLNQKETIAYQKIKTIRFSKSYTNWSKLLIQTILGNGGSGGFSRSDRMIVTFKDGSSRIYNRFGNRENFIKAIKLINNKI